jgi:predicted HTH transcriptional regulator
MTYFLSLGKGSFTRKDYMEVFKTISTATASRDLKKAVEDGNLRTEGGGNLTRYFYKNNI